MRNTLLGIIIAAALFVPSFVLGVAEYCFYFINGGVGEDCYEIENGKIRTDTYSTCNVYKNELKQGNAVIANLAGAIEIDVAKGCPNLSLGTHPDSSKNTLLSSVKTPKGYHSMNFGGIVGQLVVDTDSMAQWAGKIGKENKFVESASIWLSSQLKQQETDFKNEFTAGIKTLLEKERDKLCCIFPKGSGTQEKFSCSMPTSDDSKIQTYVDGVASYVKNNNGSLDATAAFDEFTKILKGKGGSYSGSLLKKVDLYKCGDNALANPKLYEYSCTDTEHTNILPPNQSGSLSGSLSTLCNLDWGEVSKPPAKYDGIALDLKKIQGLGNRINKIQDKSVQSLTGRILKTAMGIMGSIALVMIMYGGVLWMVAGGNSDKAHKSLQIIIWSALGIAVVFASYALVDMVFKIF